MGTTTYYNQDYNTENSINWWTTWVALWEFVDAELVYRTKDLNMKGFTLYGSDLSGGNLILRSTTDVTKGKILFGTSAYDEVNNRLGIGTTLPVSQVEILKSGIGNTFPSITNGLALTNSTAATSGAPVQQSPPLTFKGSAWDTDDAVSRNIQFSIAAGSAGAGATPNRRLSIFDSSLTGTPLTVAVANAGSGYAPLDKIYLVEPGNTTNLEYVEVLTVGGSGEVLTISPPYTPSAGSSSLYTTGIKATTSSGAGINCTINVSALVSELYRFNQFGGFILSPQSSYRKTQIYNGSAWFLDNNPTIGPYMRLVSGSIAVSIYLTGRDHFLGGDKFIIANQANLPMLTIDPATGNAGFGTLTPGSRLDVDGDIRSTGFMEHLAMTVPTAPPADSMRVYVKASGTTPNREVAYCIKDETGSEMIVTSVLV